MDRPARFDDRIERPANAASPSESGSAFIITLLVLLVLTVVGLTLLLITRTELLLSDNERTIERSFYAADSGVAVATAQILHRQKTDPATLAISDVRKNVLGGTEPLVRLRDTVRVSRTVPILDMPCDLCQVNSGDTSFHLINHAVTSTASREAGLDDIPMAETAISAMILIQPWMRSTATLPTSSDEVAQIRN